MLHMWFIIWSEKLTPCPCCLSIFLCAPLRAHGHECDALAVFMWEVVCRCVCPQVVCMCCRKCVFVICETERTKSERESAAAGHQSPLTCGGWSVDSSWLWCVHLCRNQAHLNHRPRLTYCVIETILAKDSKRKERWLKVHCPANHRKISSLKLFYS